MNKEIIYTLNMLKLIAILLVFNSHCDALYPNSFMATGGALGNALFFIISGFLLNINDNFIKWIIKKIKRIYIPTIIMTFILCIIEIKFPSNITEMIKIFIWPTKYWFVGALVIFYVLIYILNKINIIKNFKFCSIITIILYFTYYILFIDKNIWSVETSGLLTAAGLFKLIYYFYIFYLGNYLKNKLILKRNYKSYLIEIILIFLVYFLIKLLLLTGIIPMSLQFLTQFIGILFAYVSLKFAISYEQKYKIINKKIINSIDYLSSISFELYLTQFIAIKYCYSIVFPINIAFALILAILLSVILKKIIELIFKYV